ncbi:hypothetical protein [Brevibacillus sp. SYSU BS000544]|uniref:hypothetical protein n=1 Tax=Brevibacillus sp. SYSU BS000544 TaxID=3416443 RepID=UPI003CE5AA8E
MAGEFTEYGYIAADKVDIDQLKPLDQETGKTMKEELGNGLKLTLIYFTFIFAMPVLNWFAGDFMFSRMWGGMTYAWFFTGILAMLMAFVIACINIFSYEKRLQRNDSANNSKIETEGRQVG